MVFVKKFFSLYRFYQHKGPFPVNCRLQSVVCQTGICCQLFQSFPQKVMVHHGVTTMLLISLNKQSRFSLFVIELEFSPNFSGYFLVKKYFLFSTISKVAKNPNFWSNDFHIFKPELPQLLGGASQQFIYLLNLTLNSLMIIELQLLKNSSICLSVEILTKTIILYESYFMPDII